MKASKLIEEIQKNIDQHGDLPIEVFSNDGISQEFLVRAYNADNHCGGNDEMVKLTLHVR